MPHYANGTRPWLLNLYQKSKSHFIVTGKCSWLVVADSHNFDYSELCTSVFRKTKNISMI